MDSSMTAMSTQIKSFWNRKEGTTGKIVLALIAAGVIVGGYIALPMILPTLISILSNTLHALFLGGVLAGIGVVLWDKRFRMLVATAYQVAMRAITSAFITIDPIGILKNHIHTLDEKIEDINEQLNKVKGVIVGLRRKVESYLQDYKKYMDLAEAAKKRNEPKLAMNNSMFAQRRKDSSEKLAALHRKLEAIYRVLQKMYENCKIVRDQTADEVEMKESEWIAIRSHTKP